MAKKIDEVSYVEAMVGRLIVKPDSFKYSGALVVPEKYQRKPTVGTIVQVNLTPEGNPNNLTIGDRIVYGVYSGTPVVLTISGEEQALIVLTPEEVLVRLRGEVTLKEAGQGY